MHFNVNLISISFISMICMICITSLSFVFYRRHLCLCCCCFFVFTFLLPLSLLQSHAHPLFVQIYIFIKFEIARNAIDTIDSTILEIINAKSVINFLALSHNMCCASFDFLSVGVMPQPKFNFPFDYKI